MSSSQSRVHRKLICAPGARGNLSKSDEKIRISFICRWGFARNVLVRSQPTFRVNSLLIDCERMRYSPLAPLLLRFFHRRAKTIFVQLNSMLRRFRRNRERGLAIKLKNNTLSVEREDALVLGRVISRRQSRARARNRVQRTRSIHARLHLTNVHVHRFTTRNSL